MPCPGEFVNWQIIALRITFDVDTGELFDMLKVAAGNCEPIGQRLVGAMMTGEAGFADTLGMAYYGIVIHNVETIRADHVDEQSQDQQCNNS